MKRMRLAILASHVIQYQAPFFRRLAREPELDVTVLYASREGADVYLDKDMGTSLRWDLDLLDGYTYEFVNKPKIVAKIASRRYDAMLFMLGWGPRAAQLGLAAATLFRMPILMFGDSSFLPEESSLRGRIRAGVMRLLVGSTSAFLISGTLNADYYRHYGADPKRFFPLPWAIDNERFAAASQMTNDERAELRARYGIDRDAVAILYSAKLIERKDPMALLEAFATMQHRDRAALVFMGDGMLRPKLEAYVREHDVPGVHFTGFVNQREIPKHYAMCDVFSLPSHFDPRATVVNEAMACGLPVVITNRCGPYADIARDGDNAFIHEPGDVVALRNALDALAGDDELRQRMGARSREIIATWDYERGVEGVKEAMRWLTR